MKNKYILSTKKEYRKVLLTLLLFAFRWSFHCTFLQISNESLSLASWSYLISHKNKQKKNNYLIIFTHLMNKNGKEKYYIFWMKNLLFCSLLLRTEQHGYHLYENLKKKVYFCFESLW